MVLRFHFHPRNHLRGLLIYAAGDTAAALLLHQFSVGRLLGMALVGGLLYSLEVPAYFSWIDRQVPPAPGLKRRLGRAALSLLYFNPLWIARHMLFIQLFSGHADQISTGLLAVALRSFLLNVPVSFAANYLIQNHIPPRRRFLASALFSGLMAVYYALSATWLK
ncbi:hypothetical protein KBK19_11985 [Microvirga sp. STR05]|uniref:Uncharacterized protein n=1 Tax=Hymenobacter duratus TaxID=2771356 RepID=A0ABR8JFW6_9BACT|nr:hypothetical protein [Hymenobacter duratus]MBD2715755.1 hypothetical protein [Hymenobacter duratus]MBR7950666.1 hypothetical protein [Microvirga sp. STR05]